MASHCHQRERQVSLSPGLTAGRRSSNRIAFNVIEKEDEGIGLWVCTMREFAHQMGRLVDRNPNLPK